MEELILTDPVVIPEKVTSKYKVITLSMNIETIIPPSLEPGLLQIHLKDNNGAMSTYIYTGKAATDYIKFINTANFTTKSLHKRILEKLSTDGFLPGTVTGAPDV